jgi:hypothetical protein
MFVGAVGAAAFMAAGAWAAPAAAGAVRTAGGWGRAIVVPGLAALNAGGNAQVRSVSCASAGYCGAGGSYKDGSGHDQAWVASEQNGRWHWAIEVPGLGALNAGGTASVYSVSCGSAGNCAAGGYYTKGSGHSQAWVASEQNGRWHRAIAVPGTGALNAAGDSQASSVSCGSAGNCAAGGYYLDGSGHRQAWVAGEQDGRWHRAIAVPGTGALIQAAVASLSCRSAGSCAAGGAYFDGSGHQQVWVASEQNGRWGRAIEVPGSAALNAGGSAGVESVSCGSAGNCAAGGFYGDGSVHNQAWVAREQNGRWGRAIEVPGSGTLNMGGNANVRSVSCGSAGNCTAAGHYFDVFHHFQVFVASEQNGRWHRAIEVPGSAVLNAGGNAEALSVSCASAGNCAAGGDYEDGTGHGQAFLALEQNGRWHWAIEVPGSGALNAGGDAYIGSVSCTSAGKCVALGAYKNASGAYQAFVVSQT